MMRVIRTEMLEIARHLVDRSVARFDAKLSAVEDEGELGNALRNTFPSLSRLAAGEDVHSRDIRADEDFGIKVATAITDATQQALRKELVEKAIKEGIIEGNKTREVKGTKYDFDRFEDNNSYVFPTRRYYKNVPDLDATFTQAYPRALAKFVEDWTSVSPYLSDAEKNYKLLNSALAMSTLILTEENRLKTAAPAAGVTAPAASRPLTSSPISISGGTSTSDTQRYNLDFSGVAGDVNKGAKDVEDALVSWQSLSVTAIGGAISTIADNMLAGDAKLEVALNQFGKSMISMGIAQAAFGAAEVEFKKGDGVTKIIAGAALVAAGAVLVGATAKAVKAGSAAASAGGGAVALGSFSTPTVQPLSPVANSNREIVRPINININGKLIADGNQLIAVLNSSEQKNIRITGRRGLS